MKLRSGTNTGSLAEQRKKQLIAAMTRYVIFVNSEIRMYKAEVKGLSDHEILMRALHMNFWKQYSEDWISYEKAKDLHEIKIMSAAVESIFPENTGITKEGIKQLVQRLINHDLKMLF